MVASLSKSVGKIALDVEHGGLAMVMDGFHSLVDSLPNQIGFVMIRLAARPADVRYT
jgi:divalent metal cation (Fe/Co/Zn/Cd) transporter